MILCSDAKTCNYLNTISGIESVWLRVLDSSLYNLDEKRRVSTNMFSHSASTIYSLHTSLHICRTSWLVGPPKMFIFISVSLVGKPGKKTPTNSKNQPGDIPWLTYLKKGLARGHFFCRFRCLDLDFASAPLAPGWLWRSSGHLLFHVTRQSSSGKGEKNCSEGKFSWHSQ